MRCWFGAIVAVSFATAFCAAEAESRENGPAMGQLCGLGRMEKAVEGKGE